MFIFGKYKGTGNRDRRERAPAVMRGAGRPGFAGLPHWQRQTGMIYQ